MEGETPRGATGEVVRVGGGGLPPPEANSNIPDFNPERAHLLLLEVYGGFPRHNDGSHLGGVVMDDALWQSCWRPLAVQLASWYAMPTGSVGPSFTSILSVEWQGVIGRSWNS